MTTPLSAERMTVERRLELLLTVSRLSGEAHGVLIDPVALREGLRECLDAIATAYDTEDTHRARVAELERENERLVMALERVKSIQHSALQTHDDAWLEATVIDSQAIINAALAEERKND